MLLEKGMILYSEDGTKKYTINRVTAKRAFIKVKGIVFSEYEECFDREQENPFCFYHRGQYDKCETFTTYSIETVELKSRYEIYQLVNKFKNINPERLTISQLKQIINIVNT